MALQADVIFNNIPVTQAYVKIERLFGSKKENWGCVLVYAVNKEAADKGEYFDTKNFYANYVHGEQAYVTLYKAIKEKLHTDAVDVLEEVQEPA